MAGFERDIVDGTPCHGNAVSMEVHGLALHRPNSLDIDHIVMEYAANNIMRGIADASQLALFMEQHASAMDVKGPLIGLWATQLCASHIQGLGIVSKGTVLERLGNWFLPTEEAYAKDRFKVANEEPYKTLPWFATANRVNRKGKIRIFSPSLTGIILPRTPSEADAQTIYEAIPLATVSGRTVFGFLHRRLDGSQTSIEQVMSPASAGRTRRSDVGPSLRLS